MSRDYRYFLRAGVTLGLDVTDKIARIAISFCSNEDDFNRRTGKELIDLLFDASDSTLKAVSLKKNVFSFPYQGNTPRKDILSPLVDFLTGKELPFELPVDYSLFDALGERELHKFLIQAFDRDIQTVGEMREFAEFLKNQKFIEIFEEMLSSFDEDRQEEFKNLDSPEEICEIFFDWVGSVDSILNLVKKFTSGMKKLAFQNKSKGEGKDADPLTTY